MSRQGHFVKSPTIYCGETIRLNIESQQGRQIPSSLTGLGTRPTMFPTINCGAIFKCSVGAGYFLPFFLFNTEFYFFS